MKELYPHKNSREHFDFTSPNDENNLGDYGYFVVEGSCESIGDAIPISAGTNAMKKLVCASKCYDEPQCQEFNLDENDNCFLLTGCAYTDVEAGNRFSTGGSTGIVGYVERSRGYKTVPVVEYLVHNYRSLKYAGDPNVMTTHDVAGIGNLIGGDNGGTGLGFYNSLGFNAIVSNEESQLHPANAAGILDCENPKVITLKDKLPYTFPLVSGGATGLRQLENVQRYAVACSKECEKTTGCAGFNISIGGGTGTNGGGTGTCELQLDLNNSCRVLTSEGTNKVGFIMRDVVDSIIDKNEGNEFFEMNYLGAAITNTSDLSQGGSMANHEQPHDGISYYTETNTCNILNPTNQVIRDSVTLAGATGSIYQEILSDPISAGPQMDIQYCKNMCKWYNEDNLNKTCVGFNVEWHRGQTGTDGTSTCVLYGNATGSGSTGICEIDSLNPVAPIWNDQNLGADTTIKYGYRSDDATPINIMTYNMFNNDYNLVDNNGDLYQSDHGNSGCSSDCSWIDSGEFGNPGQPNKCNIQNHSLVGPEGFAESDFLCASEGNFTKSDLVAGATGGILISGPFTKTGVARYFELATPGVTPPTPIIPGFVVVNMFSMSIDEPKYLLLGACVSGCQITGGVWYKPQVAVGGFWDMKSWTQIDKPPDAETDFCNNYTNTTLC